MLKSVSVPDEMQEIFEQSEIYVSNYFKALSFNSGEGTIDINGERYILVRAQSLSVNFLEYIRKLYPSMDEDESYSAVSRILFEMAFTIGKSDAKAFHKVTNVTNPIEKLSTGPIHFSYTGWAYVDIDKNSNPTTDEDYYLLYDHPHSFEADSWIKHLKGATTSSCVCHMNAGYSSGWCSESFGIEVVSKEILCRAKGDSYCRFIMSRENRLEEFIEKYKKENAELF